jgi:hypothetical protein
LLLAGKGEGVIGIETKFLRMEKIKCPECKTVQEAKHDATVGWPYFAVLVHECKCGFIIGESEWEVVKDDQP